MEAVEAARVRHIGRVAAGAVAEKYLRLAYGVEITAFTGSVGNTHLSLRHAEHPTLITNPACLFVLQRIERKTVNQFLPVRCPDEQKSREMEDYIAQAPRQPRRYWRNGDVQ